MASAGARLSHPDGGQKWRERDKLACFVSPVGARSERVLEMGRVHKTPPSQSRRLCLIARGRLETLGACPKSLLQNSSNAANFPCVRGGGAAGAQAGAGLSCVTR